MHKRLVITLVSFVGFMFIFSYLMVPIFTYVCEKTGMNGRAALKQTQASPNMTIDTSRLIKIEFASTQHGNFPFKFEPLQRNIYLHPGERKTIYYYAENTGHDITVQAIPSITPIDAARFFKKIECFCFTQQHFDKHEKAKMFVNFYLDRDIPADVKEVTLAYTLYDISENVKGRNQQASKGRIAA